MIVMRLRYLTLQILSYLMIAAAALFFIRNVPVYYDVLRSTCILQSCEPIGPLFYTIETLSRYRLTPDSYALAFVLNDCGLALVYFAAAVVILLKSKRDGMALLAAVALVTYGCTFSSLLYLAAEGHPAIASWTEFIAVVGRMALFLFLLLFPNGKLTTPWTLAAYVPFCLVQLLSLVFPGTPLDPQIWPGHVRIVYYGIMIVTALGSQIHSYLKRINRQHRQQTKWVVYGAAMSFLGFFVTSGFIVLLPSPNPITYISLIVVLSAAVSIIPITLAFAVLRHRLWDIDPLVNRTLLYGALSLSILLVYSLSVWYLGNLFQARGNYWVSLIATAIVAVMFGPLKEWLQKLLKRLMKGRHDDPYAVLAGLGNQLIKPIDPEEMVKVVAESVRDALRLPYAAISIDVNGVPQLAASSGVTRYDTYHFPILHGGDRVGSLTVSSRSPDEAFSPDDRKLLEVMLRQAGPIVQNVNMHLGMKLLAGDLQESREKLVLAREEERRQIRRNLHDELAPRLLSLGFNVAAAEQYIGKNPDTAKQMLSDLRGEIRSTVTDIRTLVHDMRPPALDEFGLLGAIQARIDQMHLPELTVRLHGPKQLPPLPAAVEVAAYRIVVESFVNVVKHARATSCDISIDVHEDKLILQVEDNGIGLSRLVQPEPGGGIGLHSIQERAAELGGHCTAEPRDTGGTVMKAVIPFGAKGEVSA